MRFLTTGALFALVATPAIAARLHSYAGLMLSNRGDRLASIGLIDDEIATLKRRPDVRAMMDLEGKTKGGSGGHLTVKRILRHGGRRERVYCFNVPGADD